MIKVLLLPLVYGSERQQGVINAFKELGCELEVFDFYTHYENHHRNQRTTRQSLIETAKRFKPDLVYAQIQHTVIIDRDSLQGIKAFVPNVKIVQYTVDIRASIQNPYYNVSKVCDMNLICSTGQLQMYKDNGIPNVHFLHVGYSPSLHRPEIEPKEKYEFDAVLVANTNTVENYPGSEDRLNTAYALRREFGQRFGLFGSGFPKDLKALGHVDITRVVEEAYSKSFSCISISHFNEIDHYYSDRLLHCLSSSRPTVSWHFPKYESYFVDGCDLVIAKGPDDIVNKVKYLLDNKDKANFIGMNGAAKVFAEHTYLSRITEMLEMIGLR
jgi:spore maturation protein CgeB